MVLRNSIPIGECPGATSASPNPCVSERTADGGDIKLTVLTSSASRWNLGGRTGYSRPKAATPLRVPLVPAYQPCTTDNRTHAAPLGYPSCNPPAQSSPQLTIGTPEVNGKVASSVGSITLNALLGNASTPADEADLRITTSLSDVRNAADLSDYTGELSAVLNVRLTDRQAGGVSDEPQTSQDFPFRLPVPCTTTAVTTIGSTCASTTTAETVAPGAIPEGKRSIWALGGVSVSDGGPDGDADTIAGNSLFMTQGIFVP